MLAADRVDSTTGLQMAYLKQWAARSYRDLELRLPELLAGPGPHGPGRRVRDGRRCSSRSTSLYLDPPYNQHRYFTNYHVWETLVRWDEPEHYGIACKRVDARDDGDQERVQPQAEMPGASRPVARARAEVVVVSYNDESWVSAERADRGAARGRSRGARCSPSTPSGTSARRSASTARTGEKVGRGQAPAQRGVPVRRRRP